MSVPAHEAPHAETLSSRVHDATGESIFNCYQCGKCTAGCPLAAEMDYAPHQILRLLQLGLPEMEEEALTAFSIWLCLTCETCAARCPQEVDLPRIMDYLRQESLRRGLVHPKAKDILAFHQAFLEMIKRSGRLHEVGLISSYKLRTMHLLQDVLLAPKLMARGKLNPLPHSIAGKDTVRRIFERCEAVRWPTQGSAATAAAARPTRGSAATASASAGEERGASGGHEADAGHAGGAEGHGT